MRRGGGIGRSKYWLTLMNGLLSTLEDLQIFLPYSKLPRLAQLGEDPLLSVKSGLEFSQPLQEGEVRPVKTTSVF